MERKSNKKKNKKNAAPRHEYTEEYMVDGNTVKKIVAPLPQKKKPRRSEYESARVNRMVRKNRERVLSMDLPYLIMLSAAAIIVFVLCANYIAVQSHLNSVIKTTQSNESKLEKLKNENDALENTIETYVDLDHVYDVAVNKLGMIYAKKSQVITYEKTESEYVRQFEDIPQ